MKNRVIALLVVAAVFAMLPSAGLALNGYSQDFEALNQADTGALGADGWNVFGNVFGPDWSYWYGYGVYPAPNDGAAFSAIALGEGGAQQGQQQLSIYSDYNNADHANGAHIEANVFQEQLVGAGDVGETWVFAFDAKMGNLIAPTTALAFIKTLDPNNGYAMTNFLTMDTTNLPTSWGSYSISILIDSSLVGQILQFGFSSTASNYDPSGVFYDNIVFYATGAVDNESASWGEVKSLFR